MTVKVNPVANFDQLPLADATAILYGTVIPACEAKGVNLSFYGNHQGRSDLDSIERYDERKSSAKLFDVPRVQRAFAGLHAVIVDTSTYKSGSYSLKHKVEKFQGVFLSNGDLIAAMLMKGYQARFGKRGEDTELNCEFKVKCRA